MGAGQSERKMASIAVLLFVTFFVPLLSQTKFGDSQKTKDVNEKIFTGDPTIDTLGGGLIGVGLGALGASVLGPTIGQVLGGGNTGFSPQTTGGCGRRKKRQAVTPGVTHGAAYHRFFDGDFFL